jgi:hypothetical protein
MAREEGFFDDLARGLARGSITRGKALRLMGAALVGGTLASLGIGEAGADPPGCKRNGKRCKKNSSCCSDNCESGTCACIPDCDEHPCIEDSQCCSGNCGPAGVCAQQTCI